MEGDERPPTMKVGVTVSRGTTFFLILLVHRPPLVSNLFMSIPATTKAIRAEEQVRDPCVSLLEFHWCLELNRYVLYPSFTF